MILVRGIKMTTLIVKKSCKEAAGKEGVRLPTSALEALDKKVAMMIKEAAKRAKANNRKTIKDCDF